MIRLKLVTKLFIVIDVIIIMCFFLVYGPYDKARVFWITTALETGNHKYLANIFYSKKTIKKVMSENYIIETDDETDAKSVKIGEIEEVNSYTSIYERQILEHDEDALYKLIEFKYGEFDCYLVAIYDPKRVSVAYNKKLYQGKILSEMAEENKAIVAINGGGYSWSTGYPYGLIVKDGEIVYAQSKGKYPLAAINEDGVLMVTSLSASEIKEKKIKHALSFTPALIVNGNPIKIYGTGGSGLNPRTVIAQRQDGIILFLVVNGYGQKLSFKGRGGVYLNDLLVILQRYKAYNAINMDGGSSTTLVIDGKLINSPCEPLKNGQDFIRSAWILS